MSITSPLYYVDNMIQCNTQYYNNIIVSGGLRINEIGGRESAIFHAEEGAALGS